VARWRNLLGRAALPLLAATFACGSAQTGGVSKNKPEPLARQSITEKLIRQHIDVLASDDYAGRGTLEDGEAKAAEYLAKEFARFGLVPLPGHDSYRIAAKLEHSGFESNTTVATLRRGTEAREFRGAVDFRPFWFSASGRIGAELVFAGYGISRPKLDYDDYAGLDVKGKVVVVLRRAPKASDKDKRFESGRDSFFTTKAALAEKKGAAGIIVVNDPRSRKPAPGKPPPPAEDMRMSGRLQLPAREGGPLVQSISRFVMRVFRPATQPKVGAIFASEVMRDWIAEALPMPLAEIQTRLDNGKLSAKDIAFDRPLSIDLTVGARNIGREVAAQNVVGFLPGESKSDEWIVIGAHYDHLGHFPGSGDTTYNGADDNASGTAAMLALAEWMATGPRRDRSLVFVGFSAEEKGLLGSRSLARGELGPKNVVFMINMDMLGRNSDKPVQVSGDGYARGLGELVTNVNETLGVKLKLGGNALSGNSDHYPFFVAGVPVMNLFTGLHEDYHQLSDHSELLDFARIQKIASLAGGVAERIADAAEVPRFIHRPMWLGAALEVVGDEPTARALVTELDTDSPATRAGMAEGDELVSVAGDNDFERRKVSEVLNDVEPGSAVELEVRRAGVLKTLALTRARRGYLGVYPRGIDEDLAKKLGLQEGQGVLIAKVVKDGPAAKAGIEDGDIMVEIAGRPVGVRSLGVHLSRIGAGEKVPISLIRKGKRLALTMVLGARPERR